MSSEMESLADIMASTLTKRLNTYLRSQIISKPARSTIKKAFNLSDDRLDNIIAGKEDYRLENNKLLFISSGRAFRDMIELGMISMQDANTMLRMFIDTLSLCNETWSLPLIPPQFLEPQAQEMEQQGHNQLADWLRSGDVTNKDYYDLLFSLLRGGVAMTNGLLGYIDSKEVVPYQEMAQFVEFMEALGYQKR